MTDKQDDQAAQEWLQRAESTAAEYTEIIPHDELHSGMTVQLWLYGAWRPARVEYDYPRQTFYLLLFDEGQSVGTMLIGDRLQLRRGGQ
jgi:hypothetical protein